jgi:hypothetical protein
MNPFEQVTPEKLHFPQEACEQLQEHIVAILDAPMKSQIKASSLELYVGSHSLFVLWLRKKWLSRDIAHKEEGYTALNELSCKCNSDILTKLPKVVGIEPIIRLDSE